MVLLNDERIAKVRCIENNEAIICLRNLDERIQIDETRNEIGNPSELFCYARRSIAEKLLEAARNLPSGYSFCIKEAYRPLSLQKSFFEEAYAFYREKYPDQTETELYELTCQFVAPIEVAGHTTGGAIDLTLLKDGKEIEMGSGFNETPIAPQNLTYTYSKSISETAKKNRQILIQSMEQVGFINYPPEWWHWSYGDRYWAFINHCEAIYGPTDEQQIIKDKSCTYLTK